MVTPECGEEGQDGDDHREHDDDLEADPKVVEVVSLYQCLQPQQHDTLYYKLPIGFTHNLKMKSIIFQIFQILSDYLI